jgi:hypothetical protein
MDETRRMLPKWLKGEARQLEKTRYVLSTAQLLSAGANRPALLSAGISCLSLAAGLIILFSRKSSTFRIFKKWKSACCGVN